MGLYLDQVAADIEKYVEEHQDTYEIPYGKDMEDWNNFEDKLTLADFTLYETVTGLKFRDPDIKDGYCQDRDKALANVNLDWKVFEDAVKQREIRAAEILQIDPIDADVMCRQQVFDDAVAKYISSIRS